jgi:circadian clock protein KaiC
MTITPNIGHTEGQFRANYLIEPYKGITVDFQPKQNTFLHSSMGETNRDSRYKSMAEIDIPAENYTFTNFYSINDFYLILNNQIALYKSTGQIFLIISFRLDQAAENAGLLTLTQLQNAIRLSTDKKDKICLLDNKVIVLVIREEQKTVNSLIAKVKSNLPTNDPEQLKQILPYISVYSVRVDETIQNADDIFQKLMSDEPKEKNKFGYYK